ncbi:unnamed protein product [Closterium sp. NIES-54]
MFDESVPYYRLFPYRTAPLPPRRSSSRPVDAVETVEVAVDSGASGGAQPERAEPRGAGSGGAEPEREELGGPTSGGAEPAGAGPGGPSGALSRRELPSPQELREWFARRWSRAAGARGAADAGGSAAAGGAGATGPRGARTGGTGAVGPGGAPGAGATGGAGVGGPAGAGAAGGSGAGGAAGARADAGGARVVPAGFEAVARPWPYFVPLLEQVLGLPPSSSPAPSLVCPLPVQSESQLQLASPLPAPSPYAGPTGGLAERREPESHPASPIRTARTSCHVPRPRPPAIPGTHQMALRPSTAPLRVPLPSPPESSLPALADPASDSLRAASPTVTRRHVGGPAGAGAAGGSGAGGAAGARADAGGARVVPAGFEAVARPWPYFVPLLEQVLGLPPSSSPAPSLVCPLPVQSESQLQLASPLPAPSPYAGPTGGLAERREPESHPASPVRTARTSCHVPRPRPPAIPGTHQMALRPSTAPLRVPLPSPPESSLPALADPASDSLRAASPTVTRFLATVVTDPSFESTAASALVAKLVDFAAHCRLDYAASLVAASSSFCPPSVGDSDAPDIPTPRSYAEAIEGPYSSQSQAPMDAEMASWKSTDNYVDEVPPPGANIVSGMWIFWVKWPPGSPPVFKARYVARGFSQRQGVDYFPTFSPTPKMTTLRVLLHVAAQRDYELHSLDFSTAFLQGSLHEEIWLRRPPGFNGSFPAGTQWSLRRPVYGLRQAPREWHDTLRTTLAALGFATSTADPSLFLRTDTLLPPFYILVEEGVALLVQYFGLGASAWRAESSGPHWSRRHVSWVDDLATQRSSQGYTFSLGSGSVSWRSTRSSSVLSSSCEAEIYAGAMAAQELRWLTYLLTDLGEPPCSPRVLYVDNKAMLALCREHRLEHRTKHIALRYFLARELQQRGQLRLAYVASQANTADIFTKALQPCDHQRFCTLLGLVPTWPHLLTS